MSGPLNTRRNNYILNPKRQDIPTPPEVANFLASLFPNESLVFDPCQGDGNLLQPFKCKTFGIELEDGDNFLTEPPDINPSLTVCNPPFNLGVGRKLGPELFLQHILANYPETQIAMFTPMGLRLNQRCHSTRWKWLRDECPPISSIISLPLDIFDEVEFHAEIVIFNARAKLQPHYFLPFDPPKKNQNIPMQVVGPVK